MSETINCSFCTSQAVASRFPTDHYRHVACPICGEYLQQYVPFEYGAVNKNEYSSYLFHHKSKNKSKDLLPFIGSNECFDKHFDTDKKVYFASFDVVQAFYPKSISERVSKCLLTIAEKSDYLGKTIDLNKKELYSLFFIKIRNKDNEPLEPQDIFEQLSAFGFYLKNNSLINIDNLYLDVTTINLTPQGWNRVEELQKDSTEHSKNVFVAMSFAKEMEETRETIKRAIIANGLEPRIMDEIEHNHQIVPEMLYEIRQSKFVIAELTGHNNGAYFEAGYALGFGKEVIQVCNKEKFGTDGHFDVKQINTVMWETQEELFERLNARIKATIA